MKIFGETEAAHYCSLFGWSTGDSEKSVRDFVETFMTGTSHTIREGSRMFDQYRDCSLRDVERSLFFAASHFRRAHDLMITSSAAWSHVTLYYGGWHACHALLGMFGATMWTPKWVVDVIQDRPGYQELHYRKIGNKVGQEPTSCGGPHEVFWDLFSKAVRPLIPMVEARFAATLSIIVSDPTWQSRRRNDVNYDTLIGIRSSESFRTSFCEAAFPGCLAGDLSTQFRMVKSLLELGLSYASRFNLKTDALDGLGVPGSLPDRMRSLIYEARVPTLA